MNRLNRRIEIEPLDSAHGYLVTEYACTGAKRYELRGWGELLSWLIHRREHSPVGERMTIHVTTATGDVLAWEGESP